MAKPSRAHVKLMECFKIGMIIRPIEVHNKTGISQGSVNKMLLRLVAKGVLTQQYRGEYTLAKAV